MTEYDRTEVPMFPLGTVLTPGGALPLHIFEPRYRALARRCVEGGEPFGVVMIERGSEVGGGDVRANVACLAEIAEHEEFDDGRWAIIAVGQQRVSVDQWLDDDPYPRALVTSLPDSTSTVDPAAREHAIRRIVRVIAMAAEAGYQVPQLDVEASVAGMSDSEMSHRLGASVPVGPLDRHRLLCAEGPAERLVVLDDVLDGVEAVVLAAIQGSGEEPGPGDTPEDPSSGML
jgi:Lon protease-like protein